MKLQSEGTSQIKLRPTSRHLGGAALTLSLVVALLAGFAVPAQAATLSEQRKVLRDAYYAAGQQYVAARTYTGVLPRSQQVKLMAANASGMTALKVVGDAIGAATTQEAMTAAADAMNLETLRANTLVSASDHLSHLITFRTEQKNISLKALADMLSKRISVTTYRSTKARAAAFTTLLAADTAKQVGVAGKAVADPALTSSPWEAALVGNTGTIPTASGWTGFPGGCALPRGASTFTPKLPSVGPGVATTAGMVEAAKVKVLADPALAPLHSQMLRAATAEVGKTLTLSQLQDQYPPRVARLGYGWLTGDDQASRSVLVSDARKIILAGPEGMNTLTSSHLLIAAATATDWAKFGGLEETVLVRWVGPYTCLYADGENFVDAGTNIAAIHDTAAFLASAVFLKAFSSQAAALAQEALRSVQPALKTLTRDGGTVEGPGYWTYQSRAVAELYSTVPNAYVTPPVVLPSLSKVSGYALNSTDPRGIPTPFADAQPEALSPLMPAWDAHVRQDPAVGAWVRREFINRPDPYLLWWSSPAGTIPAKKSAAYPYTGLAVLQSSAGTATLKGGLNSANHAHLDLGTVSFFRRGVQWSVDPGTGSGPGYYGDTQRWTYWKPSTAAHSTLSLAGTNQPISASAAITLASSSSASVNLLRALPGVSSATRSLSQSLTSLVLTDKVTSAVPVNLTWQWVTDASVSLGTNRAILRRDGQSLTVALTGVPAGAKLTAVSAPETDSEGNKLTILTLSMTQVTSLNLVTKAW